MPTDKYVLDTGTLFRALYPTLEFYRQIERILGDGHALYYSQEMLGDYKTGGAKILREFFPSPTVVMSLFELWRKGKKVFKVKESKIAAGIKRLEPIEIAVKDKFDKPFIRLALAIAPCTFITKDQGLLDLKNRLGRLYSVTVTDPRKLPTS